MQSNVFLAMLKTQYQVASLMQIALLAHVILVLESQITKLAGVPPMQSNVFLVMPKKHSTRLPASFSLLAHMALKSQYQLSKSKLR